MRIPEPLNPRLFWQSFAGAGAGWTHPWPGRGRRRVGCRRSFPGRDHPEAGFDGFGASQGGDAPVLQHAQELGLHLGGQLANLVKEDGATVGGKEVTEFLALGSGEGPALVAKELRLDQGGGDGGAVDGNERPIGAGAGGVDSTGDQLLARSGFTEDEEGHLGGRDPLHTFEHPQQHI